MPDWTNEEMEKAVSLVQNHNMSIRKVAESCAIPRQTLQWRLKQGSKSCEVSKAGRKCLFTRSEEQVLANVIEICNNRLLPMNSALFKQHVQSVLLEELSLGIRRNIPTGFKHCAPTKKWMQGFIARNNVSFRKPEALSSSRAGVTEDYIKQWFTETRDYIECESELSAALNDPKRNFNMDETGASISPVSGRVLALKGSRPVGQQAIGNEKSNITILAVICATGEWLPPLFLLPYKRIPNSVIEATPDWVIIGTSPKGWISSETLFEYLVNSFDEWLTEHDVERPVLLWSDWHSSRLNYHTISETLSKGIVLMGLPRNCTHVLQPLDTHIFKPLKDSWRDQVAELSFRDVYIKKDNFGQYFFPFYENFMARSRNNIMKSFVDCGLCPMDPNKPTYRKLKTIQRNARPTEGVSFVEQGHTRGVKRKREFSSQTESSTVNRGTNPLSLAVCSAEARATVECWNDDMILDVKKLSCKKESSVLNATRTFGTNAPRPTVDLTKKRNEMLVSDVFRNHKFFPSPAPKKDVKPTKKTTPAEVLPSAISSKQWKKYAEENRFKKQEKKVKGAGQRNGAERPANRLPPVAENHSVANTLNKRKFEKREEKPVSKKPRGRPRKTVVDEQTIDGKEQPAGQLNRFNGQETTFSTPPVETVKIVNFTRKSNRSALKVGEIKKKIVWEELNTDLGFTGNLDFDSYNSGDYVLVRFKAEKFPGRVTHVLRSGKIVVTTMESTGDGNWIWPKKPCTRQYEETAVLKKINDPVLTSHDGSSALCVFSILTDEDM